MNMVLGTAQYKRQSDELDSLEGNEHEDSEVGENFSAENLNHREDMTQGGGHVRFVDSTIRYHLPTSGTSFQVWRGRTGLEKGLIILTVVLVLFCTVMLLILASSIDDQRNFHVTTHKVCLTPECVKVSANILSSADFSVNACDDFYQYSCGGWERTNPVPDGRPSWNMFEKIWAKNQLIIMNALEQESVNYDPVVDRDTINATKKTLAYFMSCMDANGTLEKLQGKPVLDLLVKTKIGRWPMLEQDPIPVINNLEEFQSFIEDLQFEFQGGGFFYWNVMEDSKNSSTHILQVDQGGLSLPTREYYLNSSQTEVVVVEAFKQMIAENVKLLIKEKEQLDHVPKERVLKIRDQIDKIMEFETRLANFTVPSSERRNDEDLYNKMTIEEFQVIAPFLNWTTFFQKAFAKVGIDIHSSSSVVVLAPTFMGNLSSLIMEYVGNDELRMVLENYAVMQLLRPLRTSLSQVYRDTGKGLERALLGKESHLERWRTCISETDDVIGFALGTFFIKSTFQDSKTFAQEMINGIKRAFIDRLTKIPWMDNETKARALKKAHGIEDYIGYPDYILNQTALDDKYKDLEIVYGEHFNNTLRHRRYMFLENMEKLEKPVNRTKWSMTPPSVNAYYTATKNQIVFPAGILQNPFFNRDYPNSLNFGAIGVVMGHELSHAFDNSGREFNEKGNMVKWWNNDTLEEFNKRTQCMQSQYSMYTEDNQTVNGNQTLGENIADNGGLKTAFLAYNEWLAKKKIDSEPPLPGINLTHHQLFFLSFSQVWCSVSTPQARLLQIRDDVHSPAKFRVLGVLSNSKEFADAFKCPEGSVMNPRDKCEIW